MRSRLLVVAVLGVLWAGGIVARLWQLQVVEHERYAAKAADQQRRVLELEPPRGTIYDARGRVLAVSMEVDSAFAEPRRIADPEQAAERLASVLEVDRDTLVARLASDRDFVWVERKLDPPTAAAVRELEIDGIGFVRESERYYPMRELAANVIGFVGTDHVGLAGLEARYDTVVAGESGRRTVQIDARRRRMLMPSLAATDAEPGSDLHLTIDAVVQHIVERELARTVEQHEATRGSAVILDPTDGAVLAMATYPGFDANRFGDYPPRRWRNAPVMDAYEPGSTFKIVTAAAVLERRLMAPWEAIDCEMGGITLAGVRIRDHRSFGELTLAEVIAKSSNVGAIKLGLLLGDKRLHDSIEAFGFGAPTGIDLPGESPGIVRGLERWSGLSRAYISFGQEVSVTPLQLVRAVAVVANGGELVRPHVVAAIEDDGRREPGIGGAVDRRRILRPGAAATLAEIMTGVVEAGTARRAAIDGYAVAGKTGTAQKAVDGRYSRSRFVASFVGFAPVDAPRLVAAVVVDEPRPPVYHGGQVAAPAFASMVRDIFLYWRLPPRERPSGQEVEEAPLWIETEGAPAVVQAMSEEPVAAVDGTRRAVVTRTEGALLLATTAESQGEDGNPAAAKRRAAE